MHNTRSPLVSVRVFLDRHGLACTNGLWGAESPLQGLKWWVTYVPRALPWAGMIRPVGAESTPIPQRQRRALTLAQGNALGPQRRDPTPARGKALGPQRQNRS